jgi:hypothetical protein
VRWLRVALADASHVRMAAATANLMSLCLLYRHVGTASLLQRTPGSLDQRLLDGLVASAGLGRPEWNRWQNALSCFNQANTDSDSFRHQVE